MWIGYVITGLAAGTISGMGIGGGAILIPALSFLYGMDQQAAQSINLLYFIPTAAIAVFTHRKKGNLETKGILRLTIFGLLGASLGASLALWMEPGLLRKIFGFFLLAMGLIEIFKKSSNKENSSNEENSNKKNLSIEENSNKKTGEENMELTAFEDMKRQFRDADVDAKIDMYITAEGLSQTQYKELLKLFPLNELNRLEEALA